MYEDFAKVFPPQMKIRILGASGGIGALARTTSILVDHDILIDAGTGVGDLALSTTCF